MKIMSVQCINRNTIPLGQETIADDLDIEKILPHINHLDIYFRPPEACPFGRGNWIVDFIMSNEQTMCLRLPKEMSREAVERFIKPLTDAFSRSKDGS